MSSLPIKPASETRFPALLSSAMTRARAQVERDPDSPGGLGHALECVVLRQSDCACKGGQYPYPHTHCANCAGKIEYDGDAPVEPCGRPVAVLPDGADVCWACDLVVHATCASPDGGCIICWSKDHPEELRCGDATGSALGRGFPLLTSGSAADGRDSADDFMAPLSAEEEAHVDALQRRVAVAFSTPVADVYDAAASLRMFMGDHIASCTDVTQLARADRGLDELEELVAMRRRELGARVVELTNLRLGSAA